MINFSMKVKVFISVFFLFFSAASFANDKPWLYLKPDEVFKDKKLVSLVKASLAGKKGKVKLLIDEGVNVNAKGIHGISPLYFGVINNNVDSVKILTSYGANPYSYLDDGENLLHIAAKFSKDPEIIRVLVLKDKKNVDLTTRSNGNTALQLSVSSGDEFNSKEKIKILLSYGANINAVDKYGSTTMIYAAILSRYDLVYYLLEQGADSKVKDRSGKRLLYYCKRDRMVAFRKEQTVWYNKVIQVLSER